MIHIIRNGNVLIDIQLIHIGDLMTLVVPVTSEGLTSSEVSWFSALCSDDFQFLGVPDGDLRSSWEHCSNIVLKAEEQGFRNILCPSSYQVGQDTLSFVVF